MSTRSTTHFVDGDSNKPEAIIYRHPDGYPSGHGADLLRFFADVKAGTNDPRFGDPTYLAAKLVVWLAREFSSDYDFSKIGKDGYKTSHFADRPFDFISVGVMLDDPGDIEYRYVVQCGTADEQGFPLVRVERPDGTALGELHEVLRLEKEGQA